VAIIFAGTPEFAVPSLRALHEAGFSPAAVVTQLDRPRGRGRKVESSPVKQEAERLGLRVEQPKRFSSKLFLPVLEELNPEILVLVAYGQILKPRALALFEKGCINLHPSRLPELRGAAPLNWTIINGMARTGLTTFYMNDAMDAGDVILQEETTVGENETAGDLGQRLAREGADLLVRTVRQVMAGVAPRVSQDDAAATFAPRLQKSDGVIAWGAGATCVHGKIMGMNPWPGAMTVRKGRALALWRSRVLERDGATPPGVVQGLESDGISVGCGKGSVVVTEVQVPGKRRVSAAAFARGYHVEKGERWGEEDAASSLEG